MIARSKPLSLLSGTLSLVLGLVAPIAAEPAPAARVAPPYRSYNTGVRHPRTGDTVRDRDDG